MTKKKKSRTGGHLRSLKSISCTWCGNLTANRKGICLKCLNTPLDRLRVRLRERGIV